MAKMRQSEGLAEVVLELGFDVVKYFELTASGTAQNMSFNPPARHLTVSNRDLSNSVYINITGDAASPLVDSIPGDNIRIRPLHQFDMDFDHFSNVSFITEGANVIVDGVLGWKGVNG